jgi:hypothetical protein
MKSIYTKENIKIKDNKFDFNDLFTTDVVSLSRNDENSTLDMYHLVSVNGQESGIVRTDTYTVFKHEEYFNDVLTGIQNTGITVSSIDVTQEDRLGKVFVDFNLDVNHEIAEGDIVNPVIHAHNGVDNLKAVGVSVNFFREVCMNELDMFFGLHTGKGQVKARAKHRANSSEIFRKPEIISNLLNSAVDGLSKWQQAALIPITSKLAPTFFTAFDSALDSEDSKKTAREIYAKDMGNKVENGKNLWVMYNAYTNVATKYNTPAVRKKILTKLDKVLGENMDLARTQTLVPA